MIKARPELVNEPGKLSFKYDSNDGTKVNIEIEEGASLDSVFDAFIAMLRVCTWQQSTIDDEIVDRAEDIESTRIKEALKEDVSWDEFFGDESDDDL